MKNPYIGSCIINFVYGIASIFLLGGALIGVYGWALTGPTSQTSVLIGYAILIAIVLVPLAINPIYYINLKKKYPSVKLSLYIIYNIVALVLPFIIFALISTLPLLHSVIRNLTHY